MQLSIEGECLDSKASNGKSCNDDAANADEDDDSGNNVEKKRN